MEAVEIKLYVGTYGKYNNGSIEGAWMTLNDYSDKNEFLEACKELHSDEEDPEFMYQDHEGMPSSWYDESGVDERLWDLFDLPEHEQKAVMVYQASTGYDLEQCLDNADNIRYFEDGEQESTFADLHFDAAEAADNYSYLKVDYDQWLRDNYTEVEYEGDIYYVETNC